MASGDAQRVWFPEMLEALVAAWSASMAWEELADFCERMTLERRAIRASRGIEPPLTRCTRCGAVSRADIRGVSIRSALFALKNTGTISPADFGMLDKRWQKHRVNAGLDPYGRPAKPAAAGGDEPPHGC
jgi:hypothetical protein